MFHSFLHFPLRIFKEVELSSIRLWPECIISVKLIFQLSQEIKFVQADNRSQNILIEGTEGICCVRSNSSNCRYTRAVAKAATAHFRSRAQAKIQITSLSEDKRGEMIGDACQGESHGKNNSAEDNQDARETIRLGVIDKGEREETYLARAVASLEQVIRTISSRRKFSFLK